MAKAATMSDPGDSTTTGVITEEEHQGLMHEHAQTVNDRACGLSEICPDMETVVGVMLYRVIHHETPIRRTVIHLETPIHSIAGSILETVVTERFV